MYGLPPNYKPSNPFAPAKPDPEPPPIPDAVKHRAKAQGAEFLHKSGDKAYKWHYDKLLEAYEPDFEAWYEYENTKLPAGELVELK